MFSKAAHGHMPNSNRFKSFEKSQKFMYSAESQSGAFMTQIKIDFIKICLDILNLSEKKTNKRKFFPNLRIWEQYKMTKESSTKKTSMIIAKQKEPKITHPFQKHQNF